jgi:hypothetical protein
MPVLTIAAWIAVLVAFGGTGTGAVKFLFWAYDERHKRKPHQGFSAPNKTLQLVAEPRGRCWWRMGQRGDDPTMQIVGAMLATNVSPVPVLVTRAELRHGLLGRKRISGTVMVSRPTREDIYGAFDIQPDEKRELTFDFRVYPPVRDCWESFTPHSVTFIDQFGNKHAVKRIAFLAHSSSISVRPKEPQEFQYEMRYFQAKPFYWKPSH